MSVQSFHSFHGIQKPLASGCAIKNVSQNNLFIPMFTSIHSNVSPAVARIFKVSKPFAGGRF